MAEQFWHAFIPLFVAFDSIGLLPLFWGLAQRLSAKQRREAIGEAVLTALLVSLSFLVVSRAIFGLMGLALGDLMIAGGVILVAICLRDLLVPEKVSAGRYPSPGVVPLGVPLLAGPAVLTTVLLIREQSGWALTLAALTANMAIVWLVLMSSEGLLRWLGRSGADVVSKIASLILTAFGVMLVRRGVLEIVAGR
jgi:multiple antibiotic resistance protein